MSDQEQYYLFSNEAEEIFIIIEQYIHVIIKIDLWRYINITEYNL